jgi:hypothetical protein
MVEPRPPRGLRRVGDVAAWAKVGGFGGGAGGAGGGGGEIFGVGLIYPTPDAVLLAIPANNSCGTSVFDGTVGLPCAGCCGSL